MSILKLFKKKTEPIVINNELGTFILKDPEKDKCYQGEINWLGIDVDVSLFCDSNDSLTANIALEVLRKIATNVTHWDQKLKQCIVEDMRNEEGMVEIWGNWDEEDEAEPITIDEFLDRISIGFIHINPINEIHFDYSLDGMFSDHGYGIYANFSGEILSFGLEG